MPFPSPFFLHFLVHSFSFPSFFPFPFLPSPPPPRCLFLLPSPLLYPLSVSSLFTSLLYFPFSLNLSCRRSKKGCVVFFLTTTSLSISCLSFSPSVLAFPLLCLLFLFLILYSFFFLLVFLFHFFCFCFHFFSLYFV